MLPARWASARVQGRSSCREEGGGERVLGGDFLFRRSDVEEVCGAGEAGSRIVLVREHFGGMSLKAACFERAYVAPSGLFCGGSAASQGVAPGYSIAPLQGFC